MQGFEQNNSGAWKKDTYYLRDMITLILERCDCDLGECEVGDLEELREDYYAHDDAWHSLTRGGKKGFDKVFGKSEEEVNEDG